MFQTFWHELNGSFVLAGLWDAVGSNWKLVYSRDSYYAPSLQQPEANSLSSAVS